jgi:hypothetical protein
MTFWTLPTAIEIAIFVLCLVIARIGFRLRLRPAAVALLLLCPVPLTYLVTGNNSALFLPDILGACCLVWLAYSKRLRAVIAGKTVRVPVALAAILLVVLPNISTAIGFVSTGQGDWKLIVIGLCRGCAYLGIFCAAIDFGSRADRPDRLIALQAIAFTLICCCGIWQAITGLDLRLADPTTSLYGDLALDSAAGCMGLYRGAIGAWGAAMLGVMPLVLFRRKHGWITTPVCMLIVLVCVLLVGSRQGLVIGLIAALLGTFAVLASVRSTAVIAVRSLLAVMALALGGLYLQSVSANSSYDTWISARFGSLLESDSIVQLVASRDTNMWYAIDRWFSNPLEVQALGAGRGRLVQGPAADPRTVGYVDSEIVWQLQENGLIAVLLYGCFLFVLVRRFHVPRHSTEAVRTTILAARIGLIAGVCLTYGHFFLLHVHTPQAPIAYWNWALFGAGIGVTIRSKLARRARFTVSFAARRATVKPERQLDGRTTEAV